VRDSRSLSLGDPDVVVDAILGTGISGDLRGARCDRRSGDERQRRDRRLGRRPSGFDADTGTLPDSAVDADHVVTFHDSKPGLDSLDATVTVADIGIRRRPRISLVQAISSDWRAGTAAHGCSSSVVAPTPARRR